MEKKKKQPKKKYVPKEYPPYEKKGKFEGHERQCKRIKKNGDRCGNLAIVGGDYCKFHGGGNKNNFKHGKYSKYKSRYLADVLLMLHESGEDPKDLLEELNLLKAMLIKRVEEVDNKEKFFDGIQIITSLVSEISKLVERIEKIENGTKVSLSFRQVNSLADQISTIINDEVTDEDVKRRIAERISRLSVNSDYNATDVL